MTLLPNRFRLAVAIMNTLGNLIEGARRFDEAEKLERRALHDMH